MNEPSEVGDAFMSSWRAHERLQSLRVSPHDEQSAGMPCMQIEASLERVCRTFMDDAHRRWCGGFALERSVIGAPEQMP
jgi:hypothetical protein